MLLTLRIKHNTKTNLSGGQIPVTGRFSAWFNDDKKKKKGHHESYRIFPQKKDTNKTIMSPDRHGGKTKYKGDRKRQLGGDDKTILYPDNGANTNLEIY